ncbi:MAG: GNAT family N-acetyltransferase [Candidatus Obscuribacterales bacterium]|nr:GNAT family N-acetyltransferase [Candidatus Obscuribacterales bacterium]
MIELDASKRFKTLENFPPVNADASFLDQTFDTNTLLALIEKEQVFVAVDNTKTAVGFIIVSEKSGCAYIEEVDVLIEHGQKGLGKALLDRAFSWARERSFKRVLLSTATNVPWNGPMYARLGFTPIAEANWCDEMRSIYADEKAKGLPVGDRVFMELLL